MQLDKPFSLRSANQLTNAYILSLSPLSASNQLVISSSDNTIRLFDVSTHSVASSIRLTLEKENIIQDVSVIDSLAYVATSTGLVCVDTRTGSIVHTLATEKPLLSCSASQEHLACGTELLNHDADLYLFDRRSQSLVTTFSEVHSDDITTLAFHPTVPTLLTSGSTDGLVVLYNLSTLVEDDVIHQTIKESSINKISYFGDRSEYLSVLTHMETLSLWKCEDGSNLASLDVRGEYLPFSLEYLVDTIYSNERLYLVAGNQTYFSLSLA